MIGIAWESILIASIPAAAMVIAALVPLLYRLSAKQRQQGSQSHDETKELLGGIVADINGLRLDMSDHMKWHAHAAPNVVNIVRQPAVAEQL